MTCMRCHGLLLETLPLTWSSSDSPPSPEDGLVIPAWQCVNCGDCIDAVILANRMAPPPPVEVSEASPEALVA
jgi:hypothetical protein